MTYRLQKKSLPAAADPAAGVEDVALMEQDDDDSRKWSGELYEGDAPPEGPGVDTTASFSHPNGEAAWLDAKDGALTGWVRDVDGSLYIYSDPDAWSTDVDGAQMAKVDSIEAPVGDDEAGSLEDEQAEDEQAEDDAALAGDDEFDAGELFTGEDDDEEDAGISLDDPDDPDDPDEPDEPDDEEDDEEEDVFERFKKGTQVKSFPAGTLPRGRTMILVDPRG